VQVCQKTDIYEGTIVRACRRLDELMQQLARAAEVIGDRALAARITESNDTMRRDIMFTASLYVA
jgi:ATP-dependent RNA helicase DOB1